MAKYWNFLTLVWLCIFIFSVGVSFAANSFAAFLICFGIVGAVVATI